MCRLQFLQLSDFSSLKIHSAQKFQLEVQDSDKDIFRSPLCPHLSYTELNEISILLKKKTHKKCKKKKTKQTQVKYSESQQEISELYSDILSCTLDYTHLKDSYSTAHIES